MGQTSEGRLQGFPNVLQTLLVAPASWFQYGGAGNNVNQDLGQPFWPPLWRWRKMVALPSPAAILDDLISGFREWGHPRWRPEAERPPSCATATMGIEKAALYYYPWSLFVIMDIQNSTMDMHNWILTSIKESLIPITQLGISLIQLCIFIMLDTYGYP